MTPCNIWLWATNSDGYGMLKIDGKTQRAHRVIWEQYNGPIPDGLVIRHKCDNTHCTNIDHMELGTRIENNQDREDRGRGSKGEHRPNAKLAVSDIYSIRADNRMYKDIAPEYGVSAKTISNVKRGIKWKSV